MKALALLEAPEHVCGRYRIAAFAPAMVAAGWSVALEGIARAPLARIRQLRRAGRYDAVILQRKLLPGWQLAILRRSSRRLIFDFDDAVLYRDSYDPRGPDCRRRAARFAATVRTADVVLAGNGFLGECAVKCGAKADCVRVLPTGVAASTYTPKTDDPTEVRPMRLVWIGSSSTLQGLEAKRSLLECLGREVPGLTLRIIADRFPRFDPLPVEAVAWSEATEAADLASSDVGISWVPDDLWSRGKCGLKLLQYGAAGLPTLANPVGVHPEIVIEGETGYLPRTDDEWVAAVRRLSGDPGVRSAMGRAARSRIEDYYSVDSLAGRFVAAVAGSNVPAPKARLAGRAVRR